MATEITTWLDNPELEEAFAAYLQAQESGQTDVAETILRAHPGLADEIAAFHAVRDRVPRPWRVIGATPQGEHIGEFELMQELGRGGMGVVYKARDKTLNRLVAVKVMRQERFADADDVNRFRRDAELLASLRHPNVVQIFHADEVENAPYFAMELIEGGSLARKLADGWLPTPRQAAELVRILAEAVQHAHAAGIVHRDLKPANILLASDPADHTTHHSPLTTHHPKITDFGLAKKLDDQESLTRTGAVIGTASYMAPEQAKGDSKNVGPAADIYSLGAILYELLTGRPPFVGSSVVETLEGVRHHEPWPVRQFSPSVPRDLETICLKCLRKIASDRYASARDLADDLQSFLADRPIQACPVGLLERLARSFTQVGLSANFHAYSKAYVVAGFVFFAAYAAVFLLAQYRGPEWLIWLMLAVPYTTLFSIFRQHRNPWSGTTAWLPDRQVWAIWIGQFLTSAAMFASIRLSGHDIYDTLLIGIPIQAALTGLAIFIMGCDYWGGYYATGLAWIAVSLLMALAPAWAPLVYAGFSAVFSWQVAWMLRRLGRLKAALKA
jgi:serine/threonine protein kinase